MKIHFNFILPSRFLFFQVVSFPQSPHQNPVCTSLQSHTCYMPHPHHSSLFYHHKQYLVRSTNHKAFRYAVFCIPCYLFRLRPTYFSPHPILEHPQLMLTSLKIHCLFHKTPPPVLILSRINQIHTFLGCFFKIHTYVFNIIFSYMPSSSKFPLFLRFPTELRTNFSPSSCTPHNSFSLPFDHPSNTASSRKC